MLELCRVSFDGDGIECMFLVAEARSPEYYSDTLLRQENVPQCPAVTRSRWLAYLKKANKNPALAFCLKRDDRVGDGAMNLGFSHDGASMA